MQVAFALILAACYGYFLCLVFYVIQHLCISDVFE